LNWAEDATVRSQGNRTFAVRPESQTSKGVFAMPATVPLATPVKSMNSARALAEAIAVARAGAQVGAAVDRVVRYLNTLSFPALSANGEGVLDVLHLIGAYRAVWATDWLARHSEDADTHAYWVELCELCLIG
jgi:hypothetical protein